MRLSHTSGSCRPQVSYLVPAFPALWHFAISQWQNIRKYYFYKYLIVAFTIRTLRLLSTVLNSVLFMNTQEKHFPALVSGNSCASRPLLCSMLWPSCAYTEAGPCFMAPQPKKPSGNVHLTLPHGFYEHVFPLTSAYSSNRSFLLDPIALLFVFYLVMWYIFWKMPYILCGTRWDSPDKLEWAH
jgi:hypothetical protein